MPQGWRSQYARYRGYFLNILAIYKSRKDLRIFLEILLSLATVSIFGVFALKPTLITIATLYREIKLKEEAVAKLDEKIQSLRTAKSTADSIGPKVLSIKDSVPESPFPEVFIRQLEGAAVKSSVSILGISIDEVSLLGPEKEAPEEKDLDKLPAGAKGIEFSVSVSGNYPTFLSFLSFLQNLRRPVKIDSVNITTSELEEGKILVMVVSGRTPYLE